MTAPLHVAVVVIGAGAAGLSAALSVTSGEVLVVASKAPGSGGSTPLARGGVAAAVGAGDDPAFHAADTMVAGAGCCDLDVVRSLTEAAPGAVAWLASAGLAWDVQPDAPHRAALGLEAGHRHRRILHAGGDRSGWHLARALADAAGASSRITVLAADAVELLVGPDGVGGVLVDDGTQLLEVRAAATVMATGGLGGLFAATTNPADVRGRGLAMAARAGAVLADVELVQFHPTALATGTDPLPLLTEALRGDGARLVDGDGWSLLDGVHPDGDLAPRDVVARAVHAALHDGRGAFLDLRTVGPALTTRFPAAVAACGAAGLDPQHAPVPVVPAAHYAMGGLATDAGGRTSVAGLWAAGEVARTGFHGANRLASNSLLEAVVMGRRVGADAGAHAGASGCGGGGAGAGAARRRASSALGEGPVRPVRAAGLRPAAEPRPDEPADAEMVGEVRRLLQAHAGPVRVVNDLAATADDLASLGRQAAASGGRAAVDAVAVAGAVVAGALARRESVGAHWISSPTRCR